MSICTHHCRRGEGSFLLACLPHPLDASNTIKIALKEKSFEKAKPSVLRDNQRLDLYAFAQSAIYTDTYVEQVKSGLLACKVEYVSIFRFWQC